MSRFGWAYVNSIVTGSAAAAGPTNSVQYNSGSGVFSGSSNFTFNPVTNTLTVIGTISASAYQGVSGSGGSTSPGGTNTTIQFNSGSVFSGSNNFTFDYTTNTVRLTGTLYADTLIVSSSTIFKSGSTIFGDDPTDTHQFTGSIYNTALVSGTIAAFTTITGSTITSNLITGSSLVISASVISASTYLGISVPTANGGNKAIQFASGSSFSGSTNFTFDYTTNVLSLTGTTLISGSLTATNTITATSASFLDYVQLGTSLSDEAYFNASLKTNIQPATTNDVDLGASSRFWRTGYITTLSSSAISSSVSIKTGEITATSIVLNGNLSSSGNINGSGLQISGGGQFGGTVTVTGSVSSSVGLQTAGTLTVGSNAIIKNGLVVTGTVNASSFVGDGNNITGINGANVNGVGDDWTIQFKDGNTGTLTGSSGLTFSGSALTASIGKFDTIIVNRTSTSSSISLTSTQHIIAVNTSGAVGAVTLSLPNASTLPSGKHYVIKDEGGKADSKNIIVSCSVFGQTIDGNSSVIATSPYAALNIYCDGTSNYFIY